MARIANHGQKLTLELVVPHTRQTVQHPHSASLRLAAKLDADVSPQLVRALLAEPNQEGGEPALVGLDVPSRAYCGEPPPPAVSDVLGHGLGPLGLEDPKCRHPDASPQRV